MQVCNFFLKKVITTVFIISFFASSVFAQEMPKMPSMPDVSDISFPEIGDTFYHPSVPYRPKGKTTQSEDDNSFVKNDNIHKIFVVIFFFNIEGKRGYYEKEIFIFITADIYALVCGMWRI